MISSMLTLFTIIIATDSTASQVAFTELTLASNPSVGVGLTTQLVADAFNLLDLDKNKVLSVDEMAPVILPLMKIFALTFADDSGAYVLQEKFVNHLYVPDFSTITGTVGAMTCAAESMLVDLDSSTLWTGVFGDAAHVEIETFAETVYSIVAEGQEFKLADLESLMLADLPTDTHSLTLLDEYTVGNENCATSADEGRRNLVGWYTCLNWMNSGYGQLARFGFMTVFSSAAGCIVESQMGDDCTQSVGAVARAIGVGSGLGGLMEGIPYFMRRFSIWPFVACPVYEAPLDPVVYGVPRFPTVITPGGPGVDPADFEAPDVMEAPELGEIATGAGEAAAAVAEGAAGVAEGGAVVAEGAGVVWGVLETVGLAGLFG